MNTTSEKTSYIASDNSIGVFHRQICSYAVDVVLINAVGHYK